MNIFALLVFLIYAASGMAADRYMVEYTTSEPCYECGYRYAVYCPRDPNCGLPYKDVTHTETFDSKEKAIAFLNVGMHDSHSLEAAVNGDAASAKTVKFKGLYRLSQIKVSVNKAAVAAFHTTETEVLTYQVEDPEKLTKEK